MNSTNNSKPKTHKGRRKVNMEKMENDSNLQVTFSKRRVGLFKKASELCTLTGSEAAVVVFSPGDKAHSFGHPDVNTVVDRYLNPNSRSDNNVQQSLVPDIKDQEYAARPGNNYSAGGRANHVQQSSALMRDQQYLALVESQIRAEKARGEVMNKTRKGSIIGKLNYQQLEYLRGAVVDFGKKLETQVEKGVNPMMMQYEVVPSGTVIPYDQGATDAGEDDEFNNGYGHGTF